MALSEAERARPRIFNTAIESGLRSLILLTEFFPARLALHKLVILDHLIVHSSDIDGPLSLHPRHNFRAAEILVRRQLVSSGLSLMGTRKLVTRSATPHGFRFQAGEEGGSFVDLLRSPYTIDLKVRARWLREELGHLSEHDLTQLIRQRIDDWSPEFEVNIGPTVR